MVSMTTFILSLVIVYLTSGFIVGMFLSTLMRKVPAMEEVSDTFIIVLSTIGFPVLLLFLITVVKEGMDGPYK